MMPADCSSLCWFRPFAPGITQLRNALFQIQNCADFTMHKQAFCSRRYLVRKAKGACTLMYRYELQHSESVPVLHG